MKRLALPLLPALLLAGCGDSGEPAPTVEEPVESEAPPLPAFDMELPGPGQSDPQDLLDYWKGAVEAGDTDAARRAWRAEIRTGGTAPRWANMTDIAVSYGEGIEEGAAGSVYYNIPVWLAGTNVDEIETMLTGTMVLRRVNKVPGASADELSWRIDSIDWQG